MQTIEHMSDMVDLMVWGNNGILVNMCEATSPDRLLQNRIEISSGEISCQRKTGC